MPQQRLLEDNRKSVTFQKIVMLLESQSNIMKFEYKWMFVKLDVRQMVTYEFYIYQEALVTNGKFGCKYFFLKFFILSQIFLFIGQYSRFVHLFSYILQVRNQYLMVGWYHTFDLDWCLEEADDSSGEITDVRDIHVNGATLHFYQEFGKILLLYKVGLWRCCQ